VAETPGSKAVPEPEAVQVPVAGPQSQSPVEEMATIVKEHSSSPIVEAKPEDTSAALHNKEPQVMFSISTHVHLLIQILDAS